MSKFCRNQRQAVAFLSPVVAPPPPLKIGVAINTPRGKSVSNVRINATGLVMAPPETIVVLGFHELFDMTTVLSMIPLYDKQLANPCGRTCATTAYAHETEANTLERNESTIHQLRNAHRSVENTNKSRKHLHPCPFFCWRH